MKHLPIILLILFHIIGIILCIYWWYSTGETIQQIKSRQLMKVKITAYCPGACCNDQWAGLLADGSKMSDVHHPVIAADWKVLAYKTRIKYNGIIYEVRDVGGLIKGKHMDILLPTHREANEFGVKKNQIIEVLK